MPNTPVLLKNASDAYVTEKKPRKNISNTRRLYLADGSSANTRFVYMYFARPFPLGARIVSATLRLYSGDGFAGSVTMSVQRTNAKWSVNRVNWNNKPGTTGPTVSQTKSGGSNTQWSFDVTAMMQSVSDGAPWYGVRISATGAGTKFLYSAQAAGNLRPVLEVTWTDAPEPPEDLYPDGNLAVTEAAPKLRFDFTDNVGDTDMASAEVRIAAVPSFGSAYWSQMYDTSTPEADLAALGFPGLANGATAYWWVRVKDGSGDWSDWSQMAQFRRVDPGTLTITNPPSGTEPYVEEPTPPIVWSFTLPQRAYQIIITDPDAPENWLWTSGKITSTDTGVELPAGVIVDLEAIYRVIVRVWDAVDRVSTGGAKVYVEAQRDFTYKFTDTVTPPSDLEVSPDPVRARVTLIWNRGTAPDSFVIFRDGRVIASDVQPEDVLVDGEYVFLDKTAKPRKEHTWEVAAVVNGKSSSGNPTDTQFVRQVTTSLVEIDGDREMYFFNPEVDAARAEISEIQYILGDAPPVLITQSIRGYEGTVTGIFASDVVPGLSAQDQRDALKYFIRRPGTPLILTWVDKTMEVVIRNVTITPISRPDYSVEYVASFDFFQVDF